jgi:hypothetical protein
VRAPLALLAWLAPLWAAGAASPTDIVAVHDLLGAPHTVFGRTRSDVHRTLGPPTHVRTRQAPAAWPHTSAETVEELAYPGVVIWVSRRSASVRRVAVDEPRWPLPRGLNVGAERVRVEAVLGEPQIASDASVLYTDADGFPNTVELHFHDGRVRRIEWRFAPVDEPDRGPPFN